MRLRAIKYHVKLSQVQDPLDGINPKALGKQEYKIEKLANDSCTVSVTDSALTGEVRGRYVSNWEVARTEQKAETIRLKESRALRSLDYYKMKTEQEHRVHSEVELLINIAINFAKHGKLMKEWQLFKEEREKARQYREKMHNAATVVQAWWRGLLVRMKLGPYKPVGGRQKPKKK
ncbi:putative IQ motif containing G [Operophtera brumata]|uniref:Dynein regulatory complex protein 9 n=1 Tax=Operophtera brumata TaxID=104452 RepID=A0A0L7KYA1_OPEBR|nr:putative IQ motif containing G [Operophtera brumata]